MSSLVLSEEQELLQQTAREIVRENAPVAHLRALRDERDETGFSRKLWKQAAELGWAGVVFPEELGGSDLGFAELGVILEECGRTLMPQPFISTVALAGQAILLGGREDQRKELLSGVCAGDRILALAFQEHGRFAPYAVSTRAEATQGGFRISGEKQFVLDGHVADALVVVARTSERSGDRNGLGLFVVPADAPGLKIARTTMVDSRNAARVTLENVEVQSNAALAEPGAGADLLDAVFDRGAVALSSELLGTTQEAFDRTIAYLKTREQFGAPIGSFQGLKHRAAHMFCELELTRSVVMEASRAIDENRDDAATLASAAKARCSDTAGLVTREAIQMHGGIGMTDEEEIGLFLKRARAAELTLGDGAYHRDRFATLSGF